MLSLLPFDFSQHVCAGLEAMQVYTMCCLWGLPSVVVTSQRLTLNCCVSVQHACNDSGLRSAQVSGGWPYVICWLIQDAQ